MGELRHNHHLCDGPGTPMISLRLWRFFLVARSNQLDVDGDTKVAKSPMCLRPEAPESPSVASGTVEHQ